MGLFITEGVTKDVDEEAQPAGWERGVGAPCFLFVHDTQTPAGVQQCRCSCMIEWCQYHGVKITPFLWYENTERKENISDCQLKQVVEH